MKLARTIAATALLVACSKPTTNPIQQREWTPLHTAADAGDVAAIDRITKRQPGLIDAPEAGDHTPLHVAVASGRREAVAHLLLNGADLEARDVCRWTPLHMAVDNNRQEIIEFLLAKGADVNAKDCHGQTPLALALKHGHEDIARTLRQHGGQE
jgi:ankyrin repeat protein